MVTFKERRSWLTFATMTKEEMNDNLWKNHPEWFKIWFDSEAYHCLYGDRSEEEAHDLVAKLHQAGIVAAPGRALDAGCGAGRHARALAAAGMKTDAFDLSEQSIAMAKNDGRDNPSFKVLDLRKLTQQTEWQGQFDLVTNFFTSLGYFGDDAEQHAVIEGFAKAMKDEGTLLVDYLNVPNVVANLVHSETVIKNGITFNLHRRVHEGWIEKSIGFNWKGEDHHHVERVQALTLEDFQILFSRHNLGIEKVFGDYELQPWNEQSPRCLMIVRKSKAPLQR